MTTCEVWKRALTDSMHGVANSIITRKTWIFRKFGSEEI